MQLGDDDALGAVDDEGAVAGHERDFAHVDLLLLHFLHRGLGGLAIHDREADLRTQRAREGEAALLAFDDVERRLAERVAHELQARVARMAGDREHRCKGRLQSGELAIVGGTLGLEELGVRVDLRGKQEGHIKDSRALGEALADALLLGERVGHGGSEVADARKRAPACTRLALKWPGGSPLRAAGGQPCWNAWPGQARSLQSIQRTKPSPQRGLTLPSAT